MSECDLPDFASEAFAVVFQSATSPREEMSKCKDLPGDIRMRNSEEGFSVGKQKAGDITKCSFWRCLK